MPLLNSGTVNLFGPNTPAIEAQVRATQFTGDAFSHQVATRQPGSQGHARPIPMAAGPSAWPSAWSTGKEKFTVRSGAGDLRPATSPVMAATSCSPTASAMSMRLFGELNIPILKGLEVNTAVRFDQYEGVGSSHHAEGQPALAAALQVLLRGAVGKGFRAPSLQDLYLPHHQQRDAAGHSTTRSAARSPAVAPTARPSSMWSTGGDANLKPERSTNATLGIVLAPTNTTSLGNRHVQRSELKDTIVNGVALAIDPRRPRPLRSSGGAAARSTRRFQPCPGRSPPSRRPTSTSAKRASRASTSTAKWVIANGAFGRFGARRRGHVLPEVPRRKTSTARSRARRSAQHRDRRLDPTLEDTTWRFDWTSGAVGR